MQRSRAFITVLRHLLVKAMRFVIGQQKQTGDTGDETSLYILSCHEFNTNNALAG